MCFHSQISLIGCRNVLFAHFITKYTVVGSVAFMSMDQSYNFTAGYKCSAKSTKYNQFQGYPSDKLVRVFLWYLT